MKYLIDNINEYSEGFFVEIFNGLDLGSQTQIQNKKKTENKKESLLSLYLLKKGLDEFFGIKNYEILRTKNGKPYLRDEKVNFSISHSKGNVAVAFSLFPIGIDIECIRKYSSSVAQKVFSETEREFVEENDINFTKIWTLKEAAIKAQGTGIAYAKNFNFEFRNDKIYANIVGAEFFSIEKNDLVLSVCELK